MIDLIGYSLVMIGVIFDICGCIGLVRFPDVYNRLQAATKCVTLGTVLLLAGVAMVSHSGPTASKAVICAVFILITSPTAAHAIARGAHSAGVRLWKDSVIDRYEQEIDHHKEWLQAQE